MDFQQFHQQQQQNFANPILAGSAPNPAANHSSTGINVTSNSNNTSKHGDHSISNAQPSTSSAAGGGIMGHRPNSLGSQQHDPIMLMNQQNAKFGGGGGSMSQATAAGVGADRPISRGGNNINSGRLPQNSTYAISQDQQNFQLPPSAQPFHFTGGPPPGLQSQGVGSGSNNVITVANKQKFYAQISPDKAPLLFSSDKRPFTTETNTTKTHSSSKTGRGHSGGKQGGHHQMKEQQTPYLQLASKTHTGAFGPTNALQQMQMNPNPLAAHKYVSSTGQLDTSSAANQQQQLAQLFLANNMMMQQNQNHIKVSKIKPNKNNFKEKEQLYEDAIKLKIQSNAYKEENVKLKTKIKILENELSKQEKALEDFIAKVAVQPSPTLQMGKQVNQLLQQQQQQQQTMLSQNTQSQFSSAAGMSGLGPISQLPQKLQSETFLVISLKKQLKDMKQDCQKKDEELEVLRKNIKNTKQQEVEAEIKAYIEECSRMRQLMSELIKEGPNHQIYQQSAHDKIQQMEQTIQQQEFLIKQLQHDNTELAKIIKQKEEGQAKKEEEKDMRKELKTEVAKQKKTVREKDKEITRLKQELAQYRATSGLGKKDGEGASGAANGNDKSGSGAQQEKPAQQDQSVQIKTLQKKVRDLTADAKAKKEKFEEQDQVIKKLQERLQAKIDELSGEQKKVKSQEEELVTIKKRLALLEEENAQRDKLDALIKDVQDKCKDELELLVLLARRDNLLPQELCRKMKQDINEFLQASDISETLRAFIANHSEDKLKSAIPSYDLGDYSGLIREALLTFKKCQESLKDAFEVEADSDKQHAVSYAQFQEILQTLEITLSPTILDCLKAKYFELGPQTASKAKGTVKQSRVNFNFRRLLDDLAQSASEGSSLARKGSRPQTAKHGGKKEESSKSLTGAVKKDLMKDIKEEQEEEHPYEDDEDFKKTTEKADDYDEEEKEPTKPQTIQELLGSKKAAEDDDEDDLENSLKKSSANKKKQSRSIDMGHKQPEEAKEGKKGEEKKFMDEEEMLDVAEHCFIRLAEFMIEKNKTARTIFTKYSIPEQFPDGTILELMSPIAFLEGVKEVGMDDLSEMEAACLLRVLAKPELENAIILNEFTMIMENFGVPDCYDDDDDDEDDYIPDEPEEEKKEGGAEEDKKEEGKEESPEKKEKQTQPGSEEKTGKRKIQLNFDLLEEKGLKILQKLARFLLERYMHPREFFGPAIYKQLVKTKTRENQVDILQTKDFYLRMKIAGIRKTVKEHDNLNKFLCLDSKFPNLLQVKKVVKALEEVAQGEQLKMQEEMQKRQAQLESEEDHTAGGDLGEDERLKRAEELKRLGNNRDLLHETGGVLAASSSLTGGPGYGYPGMGYDYGQRMMGGGMGGGPSSAKMALLMGFTHLNTIEEEKHETQTSNYFREGGESERDDSNANMTHVRGSKILDEDLMNESSSKPSPNRNEYNFSKKPDDKVEEDAKEDYDEEEADEEAKEQEDKRIAQKKAAQERERNEEDEEYEEDEEEEDEGEQDIIAASKKSLTQRESIATEKKVKTQEELEIEENPRIETERNDKSIAEMKSVESDKYEDDEEEVQDEVEEKEGAEGNQDESDYEF